MRLLCCFFIRNHVLVDFALTALFVSIVTAQWMEHKDHAPAIIGVGCNSYHCFCYRNDPLYWQNAKRRNGNPITTDESVISSFFVLYNFW